MSLSAARSRVMQAQMYLESRRYDEVGSVLDAALGFLVGLPAEETAPVIAEITALRVAAVETANAEEVAAKVRAAERELKVARMDIEEGNVVASSIDFRFDKAMTYLEGVPAADQAPVLAEIAVLRALLNGEQPPVADDADDADTDADTGTTPAAAPAATAPEPAVDEAVNLSRARGFLRAARNQLESGWTDGVEEALQQAAAQLAGVSDGAKAELLSEVDALSAELTGAVAAEQIRRIESELDRHFTAAEDVHTYRPQDSASALNRIIERLAADDAREVLPAEAMERYRTRLAAAQANHDAVLKAYALDLAYPPLRELEQLLESDPFAGLSQDDAYRVANDLKNLKEKVQRPIRSLPADDPDVASINARLAGTDATIARADTAWAAARLRETVRAGWGMVEREIAGWSEETGKAEPQLLETPELPLTRTAIMRVGQLLADPQTALIRAENAGDEEIEQVYRAAEAVLADAVAKLAAAYHHVLDEADTVPTPMRGSDLDKPLHLATAAEFSFAGTPAQQPLLDRIRGLHQRWQDEVAAIMAERQELYDKLAVEANAAWPGIVAATGATADFDPADTGAQGRTVLLQAVYNRSGWEFADYDFSMRRDGIPIGGTYEPHVLAALEHAWYELKLDVNDRITWDVVGVVEGPGKIGERTVLTVKDKDSSLEIGKIEEWRPVDCVRLRITALHAGPVAVGPA